ncbi:MAG: type I-F CRISPR-associated protein Csy2 [Pseudolabrys sp.]
MNTLPQSDALLVLPRLRIQNANAISSPMTHGFPSITAFLGVMWALERKLGETYRASFDSVGVICHRFDEQVDDGGYVKTFCLTRNPVGKDGKTAAIVEEGRIHLDITLVFGIGGDIVDQDEQTRAAFAKTVADTLAQMRVAGGTVLPPVRQMRWARPDLHPIPEDTNELGSWFRKLRRRWLPGFALVCRDDLLAQRLERLRSVDPKASPLDAWLDLSRFNWHPKRDEGVLAKPDHVEWAHDRSEGWIVPIPVGYGALSELYDAGTVANARDTDTPLRFVESLYSIGQWIGPHRLQTVRDLLWYGHADPEAGLYRARNDFSATSVAATY